MEQLKLLKAIEQDARISVTDLADILNSEQQQVEATMKKLAEDHIICGYHTVINWDKTNQDHVMALIEVNAYPERDCGYDKVAEKIYRYPEVSNMYLISGRSEFIVIVQGRTMREVADFVGQKLALLPYQRASLFALGPQNGSLTLPAAVDTGLPDELFKVIDRLQAQTKIFCGRCRGKRDAGELQSADLAGIAYGIVGQEGVFFQNNKLPSAVS